MNQEDRRMQGKTKAGLSLGLAAITGLGLSATAAEAADHTVTTTADAGAGTLRQAIVSSNENEGSDRILFQTGLTGAIVLESDLPPITGPIEIVGPGSDDLAIDGDGQFHALDLQDTATISGFTVRGSVSAEFCYTYYDEQYCYGTPGGAISLSGYDRSVAIDGMKFEDNEASSAPGGAIGGGYGSDLRITDTSFTGNRAGGSGGAVSAGGSLEVTDSRFTDNSGGGPGGAISASLDGSGSITGSTFVENSSAYAGGAVNLSSYTSATVEDSVFSGNQTSGSGGALSLGYSEGDTRVSGSLFTENRAVIDGYYQDSTRGGGALSTVSGEADIEVENSTFVENEVENGSGGAINAEYGAIDLESVTVTGNDADVDGGGIFQHNYASNLKNSIVSGNHAASGPDIAGGPKYSGYYGEYPAGAFQAEFSLIGEAEPPVLLHRVLGSNLIGKDPQLGPLADNGGPTMTRQPAAGSPVVNQGFSSLSADQRGLKRPVALRGILRPDLPGANGADIGAVEVQGEEGPIDPQQPPTGPTGPTTGPTGPTTATGSTGPTGQDGGKITFAGLKLNKKKGVATLSVKTPGAGRVLLAGTKTVASQSKRVAAAAFVKLTVKAKGKAAKTLKKKGSVKLKAAIAFTPDRGVTQSLSKTVKLVKKKAGKRR